MNEHSCDENVDHTALEKAYYGAARPRKAADGYAIVSAVVARR
jgi:hypothetical protein